MSATPPDKNSSLARIALPSPREAAEGASVYRRRRQEKPSQRWLRIAALFGALFVHLAFMVGVILGPAYDPIEPQESDNNALQVRLIPKQEPEPPPPPPPPVRGTPPKEIGPPHKGRPGTKLIDKRSSVASASANAEPRPVPVPALETPSIAADKPSAPKPQVVAAPLPPVTLPKPAPTPVLQPIKVDTPPPQVSLETPPTAPPVPPKFQPEPVRKAQAEGNQPLLTPPSVAMPEVPPQSAPAVTPPSIAVENAVAKPVPPSISQVERAQTPAAPPVPEMADIPLPAQPAPTVNLQASDSTSKPVTVAREQPQVQSPSIRVAEAELEAVPLPDQAKPSLERPQAPPMQTPTKAVAIDKPAVERPQISLAPTPAEAPAKSEAPSSAADQKAAESSKAATSPTTQASTSESSRGNDVSTAPNATPQGSDAASPGQAAAESASSPSNGKRGLNLNLPVHGNGNNQGAFSSEGKGQGTPGSPGNSNEGVIGHYIQLKPHGDTNVMSHGTPNLGYQSTRFDKDWTPEGESSIDTALRHAVEKTTVRHTFHLAPGVRVECVVMPLFPMSLFGCGSGDPPPKPVDDKVYERMKLAPANPLVPPKPAASTAAPAAPVRLDNGVDCANARVAGGPIPPGCLNDKLTPVEPGKPKPAPSASSWVTPSDQFH
ncbi:hypothetical protein [Dyella sp. GSA-30]|uniref:hypothetical protein n=1 Tax=Dyella sp. GSA-30 TaxID=2994496 RepID=UPI0024908B2F|nr:hypothetical protein [Dyella sp. GSA-30]BDU23042.1 hypothetical protein DYGSA30_44990 [Dyella sp. GSA-30]